MFRSTLYKLEKLEPRLNKSDKINALKKLYVKLNPPLPLLDDKFDSAPL